MSFHIKESELDEKKMLKQLHDPRAGATVQFHGLVRNHNEGREVLSLAYEAYKEMAELEGKIIIDEAIAKFGILNAYCEHRVGHLEIGDVAVWVVAFSKHRNEGFLACRYIIDEVKARVPIWKKEFYCDGTDEWVYCPNCAGYAKDQQHDHDHDHKHD